MAVDILERPKFYAETLLYFAGNAGMKRAFVLLGQEIEKYPEIPQMYWVDVAAELVKVGRLRS